MFQRSQRSIKELECSVYQSCKRGCQTRLRNANQRVSQTNADSCYSVMILVWLELPWYNATSIRLLFTGKSLPMLDIPVSPPLIPRFKNTAITNIDAKRFNINIPPRWSANSPVIDHLAKRSSLLSWKISMHIAFPIFFYSNWIYSLSLYRYHIRLNGFNTAVLKRREI